MKTPKSEKESIKMTILDLSSQQLTDIPDYLLDLQNITSLDLNFNYLSMIPNSFCDKLKKLTCLSLSGNGIIALPNNIGDLAELTELYLSENELCELPLSFSQLKNLKTLNLMSNLLKNFCSVNGLNALTELILDENSLTSLPDDLDCLMNLERFEASYNYINTLPENFGNLSKLKYLNLSNNLLQRLPDSFSNLSTLIDLDLSDNKLNDLPENFCSTHSLEKIFMDNNNLVSIPTWFNNLKSVKHLSLKNNNIRGMPFSEDFGNVNRKLKHFDMAGNCIEALPESFGDLENLEFIDMGSSSDELERKRNMQNGNFLICLPLTFGKLCNLCQLYLDENSIENLPENFGDLINLEYLDLCHNNLAYLPESFGKLQSLEVCLLSINYIECLPNNFGQLQKMRELRLDNNQLNELPQSFCELRELKTLDLYKNNLKELPQSLKFLTKLVRLDIYENNFEISWEDSINNSLNKIKIDNSNENHNSSDDTNTKCVKENNSNFTFEELKKIKNALKEGASLWRQHRDGLIVNRVQQLVEEETEELWDKDLKFENFARQPTDIIWNDDNFINNCYSEESEFWDDESYLKTDIRSTSFQYDKFLPSDIHPPPIQRVKVQLMIEDGQFDDAL